MSGDRCTQKDQSFAIEDKGSCDVIYVRPKGRHPIIVNFPIDNLPEGLNGDCSGFSDDPKLGFWTCGEVQTCVRDGQPCMIESLKPQYQDGFTWMVIN